MRRKVVITGVGPVTGFGVGKALLWEGLCAGRTSLGKPTRMDLSGFRCQLGAEIKGFSSREFMPKSYRKATKVMARDTEIAVVCAKLAVQDAGLVTRADEGGTPTYPGERMGCQIGAGLIAAETHELSGALATAQVDGKFSHQAWGTVPSAGAQEPGQRVGGMDNLQPLWMLKYLPNMLACHVTIIHGAEGPSNTITSGEAAGLLSIGEGARVIERGAADLSFSGSAESKLNLMGTLRLQMAGRLGAIPADTDPAKAVLPYDPLSPGAAIGEGGGILIIEEMECARKRGAGIYAEIAGFGAAHSLSGDRAGEGLQQAIRAALKDAGVRPEEVDAIVPQACGEPRADASEAAALRAVFGARLKDIELVTSVPALGDCAAGNGGILASIGAMCVREQKLPARLGSTQVDKDLRAGPRGAEARKLDCVLVCSESLQGQNAAIVLKR